MSYVPQPDPHTTSRKDFSNFLLNQPLASNAAPKYAKLHTDLRKLFELLAYDPAMEQNFEQTYMTPAASKNKVYHMCITRRTGPGI